MLGKRARGRTRERERGETGVDGDSLSGDEAHSGRRAPRRFQRERDVVLHVAGGEEKERRQRHGGGALRECGEALGDAGAGELDEGELGGAGMAAAVRLGESSDLAQRDWIAAPVPDEQGGVHPVPSSQLTIGARRALSSAAVSGTPAGERGPRKSAQTSAGRGGRSRARSSRSCRAKAARQSASKSRRPAPSSAMRLAQDRTESTAGVPPTL